MAKEHDLRTTHRICEHLSRKLNGTKNRQDLDEVSRHLKEFVAENGIKHLEDIAAYAEIAHGILALRNALP
jgi:hypothetical protein